MHEAIQAENKYHKTIHLYNQSQQQQKLECTPKHILKTTHTQQHHENNQTIQKDESINQEPSPEETKMSKKWGKESEESSSANYAFH